MVATDKLRGVIAERGFSQRQVAKMLGITEKTFYLKMKNRVFTTDEAFRMAKMLRIEKPEEIFLAGE